MSEVVDDDKSETLIKINHCHMAQDIAEVLQIFHMNGVRPL